MRDNECTFRILGNFFFVHIYFFHSFCRSPVSVFSLSVCSWVFRAHRECNRKLLNRVRRRARYTHTQTTFRRAQTGTSERMRRRDTRPCSTCVYCALLPSAKWIGICAYLNASICIYMKLCRRLYTHTHTPSVDYGRFNVRTCTPFKVVCICGPISSQPLLPPLSRTACPLLLLLCVVHCLHVYIHRSQVHLCSRTLSTHVMNSIYVCNAYTYST